MHGKSKRLRIWSAGCSTGQEPYSLAMVLGEVIPDIATWDVQILATDVSRAAVETGTRGWYSNLEMGRGMDRNAQSNFFTQENGGWQISEQIRRMVKFETRNLLSPFPEADCFDIVFCRNVAIYFRKEQSDDLFHRIVTTMTPGGFLFVGSAESLAHLGEAFTPQVHCNCALYRPKPSLPVTQAV